MLQKTTSITIVITVRADLHCARQTKKDPYSKIHFAGSTSKVGFSFGLQQLKVCLNDLVALASPSFLLFQNGGAWPFSDSDQLIKLFEFVGHNFPCHFLP
jgi:hypothetical protein